MIDQICKSFFDSAAGNFHISVALVRVWALYHIKGDTLMHMVLFMGSLKGQVHMCSESRSAALKFMVR